MAISLSYLGDLARVHIAISGITPDGAVRVERAFLTPDPPWMTVRGGVALPIVSGSAELDDFEYADAVLNHYRLIRVDPPPGLQLPGASGDYASAPDAAPLDITGDIDLRCDATLDDWLTSSTGQVLVAKYNSTGDQRSYRMFIDDLTGLIVLEWSTDGTLANRITELSTMPVVPGADNRLAVRATLDVDNGASGYTVRFYTAPTINDSWTQLGDPVDNAGGGTTSVFAGTATLAVGASSDGTGNVTGTIHAAAVLDGINGTEVANPDFAAQDDGTTSFSDAAGNTWTVNGNAEILGEELDGAQTSSITPDNNGQTWIKSIRYPALNRSIGVAPDYRPVQRSSRTGVFNVKGRVPPVAVYDAWTSQWWTMEYVTNTLAEARDMDLVLAASRTLFIQVPPEFENECFTNPVSGMPGGYVMAQNSTMTHAVPGSHVMRWVLPVRVVAPPVPEISGTTVTWKTLQRLYGSWEALWASNATWRDVWALIGEPEDFVNL